MSEEWDVYPCRFDEDPATIMLDMGIAHEIPIAGLEHSLRVRVPIAAPTEDGLPTPEESPALDAIEEAMAPSEDAASNCRYLGRVTCAGARDFFFQVDSPETAIPILETRLAAFPNYRAEFATRHDPEWAAYRELLYPTPREYQLMGNQRVLAQLAEHGDDHSVPREVTHWIGFQNADDRDAFADTAQQDGFRLVATSDDDDQHDLPFGLTIGRDQPVTPDVIDAVVLELFDRAEAAGGDYDGWETSVATSPAD